MVDPELYNDESIILKTPDVFVKSIPFEAILTNKRIILVDRKKDLIPPKDILLATIRDVEPSENAIRDQIITLSIITNTGGIRQVVLTFPRQAGGGRKRERDQWAKVLRELTSSPLQNAIRRVIPEFNQVQKSTQQEITPPPRIEITSRPGVKKEIEGAYPIKKIIETTYTPPKPIETTSLPNGVFCTRCGNRVPPESVFCNRCGTKVIAPEQVIVTEPATQPAQSSVLGATIQPTERRERPIDQEIRSIEPLIEGSVPREEPASVIPPQIQPSPETRAAESIAQQPAQQPQGVIQPQPEKRSIIPQIFLRKDIPQKSASSPLPASPPPQGGSVPPTRKRTYIAIALIIIVILAIAGGTFIYMNYPRGASGTETGDQGNLTPTRTTGPATVRPTAAPPVTISRPEPTEVSIPPDGVWVRVSYVGAFAGAFGTAEDLQEYADSGDKFRPISTENGTAYASFQKQDDSDQELVVAIYKNGALITRDATTAPMGTVEIFVNVMTATPISTTTTGAVTTTPTAVNTTATVSPKPTTSAVNLTTTQTTAPVTTATTSS
ncbi:MAG: zinc ribbon domain-containing protein [Methanoregula sp.]|nr:zinc ribbon domain-containing protein [Methanoregula sp.]